MSLGHKRVEMKKKNVKLSRKMLLKLCCCFPRVATTGWALQPNDAIASFCSETDSSLGRDSNMLFAAITAVEGKKTEKTRGNYTVEKEAKNIFLSLLHPLKVPFFALPPRGTFDVDASHGEFISGKFSLEKQFTEKLFKISDELIRAEQSGKSLLN